MATQDEEVRYQVESRRALITIDRPSVRNALSAGVISGLLKAIDRADADPDVGVLVITGAGDRVFCAGGDLGSMGSDEGFLAAHEGRAAFGGLLLKLSRIGKPSIARVNGHAMAGGLGLMLACDLAISVEEADFGCPEVDRGLFPMMVIALLQRHLGRKRSLELQCGTGKRISSQVALDWGLINQRVANGPAGYRGVGAGGSASPPRARPFFASAGGRSSPPRICRAPMEALDHLSPANSRLNIPRRGRRRGVSAFLESEATPVEGAVRGVKGRGFWGRGDTKGVREVDDQRGHRYTHVDEVLPSN